MAVEMKMPLLVEVETGTDYEVRVVLNPVLLWLAQVEVGRVQAIAGMFGLGYKRE